MEVEDDDFKNDFLRNRSRKIQSTVVAFKSSPTASTSSYIWTYRHTACDVISIVTTTVPTKNGVMKDIRFPVKEVKRIKNSTKGKGKIFDESPLDFSLVVDPDKIRKKMSSKLLSEKKMFMSKLQASRNVRCALENRAAAMIQAIFRGHLVRTQLENILFACQARSAIRMQLKEYFNSQLGLVSSWGQHRHAHKLRRHRASVVIQCAFRCYLSRKGLRRKFQDVLAYKQHLAIVRLQNFARKVEARTKVQTMLKQREKKQREDSVIKIQVAIRGLFARRKANRRRFRMRWVAATMIQCWWKVKRSEMIAALVRKVHEQWKIFVGARAMQCLVRKRIATKRVQRLKKRRRYVLIHRFATKMEAIVRGFLARVRVRHWREEKARVAAAELAAAKEASWRERERKVLYDAQKLFESVDIFKQAKKGCITDVDDIFHGRVTEDEHTTDGKDDMGDTILTIAASIGNVDFLRKCIQWGFDVNHRNHLGQNALTLAVMNNHTSAVQYLMLSSSSNESKARASLAPIDLEDSSKLLVAAAANCTKVGGIDILLTLLSKDLRVNSSDPDTGLSALHAACTCGSAEAVATLLKYKADIDAVDDMGQTPVHKAALASGEIVKMLLGYDVRYGNDLSDEERASKLIKTDIDGKDCFLLAALGGNGDVMDLVTQLVAATEMERAPTDELGWSPNDINRAIRLAEKGNIKCLSALCQHDVAYDLTWAQEETGTTVPMAAARAGQLDMLDFLMSQPDMDLSVADSTGRNILHYAACCKGEAVLAHLLSHEKAAACHVSEAMLATKDKQGRTPLHVAALEGVDMSIELIAPKGIALALATADMDGLTPLLLACSMKQLHLINRFIDFGAAVDAVEISLASAGGHSGRGCLWHLLHPHRSVAECGLPLCASERQARASAGEEVEYPCLRGSEVRRENAGAGSVDGRGSEASPWGSNFVSRSEDALRVSTDITTVLLLLRRGAKLFSASRVTACSSLVGVVEALMNEDYCRAVAQSLEVLQLPEEPDAEEGFGRNRSLDAVESCDVLVREKAVTLLSSLPEFLSPMECWYIAMSCLRFDGPDCACLKAFLDGGALAKLCTMPITAGASDDEEDEHYEDDFDSPPKDLRAPSPLKKASAPPPPISLPPSEMLGKAVLHGLGLVSWAVKLGNTAAFEHFLSHGIDPTATVDSAGNTCLHLVANFGTPEMVSLVLADKKHLQLERCNWLGQTAAMVAAKSCNMSTLRILFRNKASARTALEGKYWAWILAFAKKQERREVTPQTGRFGDDDKLFPSPDGPNSLLWVDDGDLEDLVANLRLNLPLR